MYDVTLNLITLVYTSYNISPSTIGYLFYYFLCQYQKGMIVILPQGCQIAGLPTRPYQAFRRSIIWAICTAKFQALFSTICVFQLCIQYQQLIHYSVRKVFLCRTSRQQSITILKYIIAIQTPQYYHSFTVLRSTTVHPLWYYARWSHNPLNSIKGFTILAE